MAFEAQLSHLKALEAESIHILRETAAETERPVMLYSMGKDSAALLHLASKAFYPAPQPFTLLHIDTTWKFREMYAMRDAAAQQHKLIVFRNPEALAKGVNPFDHGSETHTQIWKTEGLRQALAEHGFDPLMGARPMARLIQDTIRSALADELLFGRLSNGGKVTVDINDDGKVMLQFEEDKSSVH